MEMTKLGFFRKSSPDLAGGRVEQGGKVQSLRTHGQLAGPERPLASGSVPVYLDTVSLGVGEVEGFAHPMVRGSIEWDSHGLRGDQPGAQIGPPG